MSKRVAVPVELWARVSEYLLQRPYNEVAQLVADLARGVMHVEVADEEKEDE